MTQRKGASETPLLSIALPIYNHADRLRLQLRSLEGSAVNRSSVEFVIVDDASTDDLTTVLDEFRAEGWTLCAARQTENGGRAASMARAIRMSRGRYVMIMDGDDTFLPGGLDAILAALAQDPDCVDADGRECAGFVFGTRLEKRGDDVRDNRLPAGLCTTLLALRADHGIKGDLKEVIRRDNLTEALCTLFDSYRRVPTSLLWARVSDRAAVRCQPETVIHKVYLPGGMSDSLMSLRRSSVPPLVTLYSHIAASSAYRSRRFRWRALINYHRFLAWPHDRKGQIKFYAFALPMLIGFSYGFYEIWWARLKRTVAKIDLN